MAGQKWLPMIATSEVGFMGEAANYRTLMPLGAIADIGSFDPVDKFSGASSGNAAIGGKAINLAAKINNSVGIPAGSTLLFGAVAATTTVWTPPDAFSLSVLPLSAAVPDATAFTYQGIGARPVRAGTVVGRTYAERDSGLPFGLAVDGDDEIYLVAFDVPDILRANEIVLVRWQTRIKENRIPGGSISPGVRTKLRTLYQMYRGT